MHSHLLDLHPTRNAIFSCTNSHQPFKRSTLIMAVRSSRTLCTLLIASTFVNCNGVLRAVQKPKNQHPIIVTSILDSAYLNLNERHKYLEGNEKFEGFLKSLADNLAEKVGFTYEMTLVKDSAFGYLQDDSSWNGMIGEILRGEADMAISSITINSLRSEYVDFSTAFIHLRLAVLMRKPDLESAASSSQPFLFLKPLSWQLWTLFATSIVSITVLNHIMESTIQHYKLNVSSANSNWRQFLDVWKFVFWDTRFAATRVLSISMLIFLLIMTSAYIAKFYDIGKLRQMQNNGYGHSILRGGIPIHLPTIEEIVSMNEDIKFSVIAHGNTAKYLQRSSNPILRTIYRRIVADQTFVKSIADGIEFVVSGSQSGSINAFITEEITAKYISSNNCKTYVASRPFGPKQGFGVVLPQNSPFLKPINLVITEMKENGSLSSMENEWIFGRGKCYSVDRMAIRKWRLQKQGKSTKSNDGMQIDVENYGGIFYIWLSSLIITCGLGTWLEIRMWTSRALRNRHEAGETGAAALAVGHPENLEMVNIPL